MRGKVTIEEIGIDRSTLNNLRQDKINELTALIKIIKKAEDYPADIELQDIANDARTVLNAAILPEAEFSSMCTDLLKGIRF